ncbi:transporter [Streptomyces sp. NRRL S-87]|uniref:transporter n=1 Tax=Streptomyces sp. NRRL S-87 TaxID=1463920 RepID=UPI0004C0F93D|nr:transporter [Streptomyces sp. NRRL S-87]
MKGSFWLAWRQQRALVLTAAAVLAAAAATAVRSRSGMLSDLDSGLFAHCDPGPLYCTGPDGMPLQLDVQPLELLGWFNMALPVLIGMFWGAPLLGRDRELGTHRMVLSQGVGRTQWFAARLALAAASAVAVSGLLALLFTWWWRPAADRSYGIFWYGAAALSGSGPRTVAAALFGLAVGTLAGLLVRRVMSGMALTLLVTAAVVGFLEWAHKTRLFVAPHVYVTPGSVPKVPMGDKWSAGHYGMINASGGREGIENCPFPSSPELERCMSRHGYVSRFYEANPVSDYWTFQWTDTALLGGLAAVLLLVTTLLLRRRV